MQVILKFLKILTQKISFSLKNTIFLNSAKKHLNIFFSLHTKHLEGKYDFQRGGGKDFS